MHEYSVESSRTVYQGAKFSLRVDEVVMPDGVVARRDVVAHPGAVVICPVDNEDRIVLIRQYRHPVGAYLWELPAGLLDVKGEPALSAARRELAEEVNLRADDWHVLVDMFPSPGFSSESIRIFLARGLTEIPADDQGHVLADEEADLQVMRLPIDEAVARVFAGEIHNGATVTGILSTAKLRDSGWSQLRSANAPWSARPDSVGRPTPVDC